MLQIEYLNMGVNMKFVFKWKIKKHRNQWYTNTYYKWDSKIEQRLQFLNSYNADIVWIIAELG